MKMKWWGYLHTSGTIQVKRYHPEFGPGDIGDAHQSPFCAKVVGPFDAADRDEAVRIITDATNSPERPEQAIRNEIEGIKLRTRARTEEELKQ